MVFATDSGRYMQQADDFQAESAALHEILRQLSDADFERVTAFKGWTISDVLAHLSLWNHAAVWSLTEPKTLRDMFAGTAEVIRRDGSMRRFEADWHDGARGAALCARWWDSCGLVREAFAAADPAQRVPWAGPDMSARSSVSARLMETWAHGQEVYDELGVVRQNTDRIRNIVVLGVNTYGWTYANRRAEAPQPKPYVELTAPSGARWAFNEPSSDDYVRGSAEAFCQVVTQVRNVADTDLEVNGVNACDWMSKAQCFAGPPNDPPPPGSRVTRSD